ncbi:sensor histidine kinase [Paenibacillus sp. PL91]|uniref:sensor histidine kinase n=1 Tax=Paenibacillus sp. PL91 TaxID=2729538 RepID=UPI00145E50C6|nr:HAMP domain-containing sensor histidine kinase [Paenibacillus sp. PL91]MBC9201629.1 HAMP domain-containing histidine kinase [Paenibacillus sp. PL91]
MHLNSWFKTWFAAVFICLAIIIGCGASLLIDSYKSEDKADSAFIINQVRLKVSEIMLYLERHHAEIQEEAIGDTLQAMSKANDLSLLFAELDGSIRFSTFSGNKAITKVDARSALHYDLYTSKVQKNKFKIAFPVVDERTNQQIGNAIFTLPTSVIENEQAHEVPLIRMIILLSFLIILIALLGFLRFKINRHIIRPVHKLKDYSEAILKGDYEQKAEYARIDEIGEVYAVFDQMRLEIMYLSEQRAEQEKAQKELITNISHDIKTPLTTIKAYIDAILEGVCPNMESVMGYVEVMQTNTDKMARLVEDLLLHALKELGQISIHLTEQYSQSMLSTIIKPISHYVRSTGVAFIEPPEIANVLINVDANRIEQVISNLVANALKHTAAGDSIRMSVELEEGSLNVTIADTGKGILPQDMPFIFERYFKGQQSTKPQQEGNGLGLSICKHIIEAHSGTISFKSIKDQGTVFRFSIPIC